MQRLAVRLSLIGLLGLGAQICAAPASEDFFIVSSVDLGKSLMVLKRPTEVTLTMRYTEKTRCRREDGKPLKPSELRAGDTVFIAAAPDPSGQLVASSIRQGIMTLPELRERYLRPAR